jgi:hypothetical protein
VIVRMMVVMDEVIRMMVVMDEMTKDKRMGSGEM